jgi:hypothetical protein
MIVLFAFALTCLNVSACTPATRQSPILPNTLPPTEIQSATPIIEATETMEPSPTVTMVVSIETPEQISDVTDATLQAQGKAAFEATKTLISSLPNASRDEIVKALFVKWLDYYKSDKVDPSIRLKDYKIEEVNATSGYCPPPDKNTTKFAARVTFSVQTVTPHPGEWVGSPGNIVLGEDNWIYHLAPYVSISESNGTYIFEMEGSMPCS